MVWRGKDSQAMFQHEHNGRLGSVRWMRQALRGLETGRTCTEETKELARSMMFRYMDLLEKSLDRRVNADGSVTEVKWKHKRDQEV